MMKFRWNIFLNGRKKKITFLAENVLSPNFMALCYLWKTSLKKKLTFRLFTCWKPNALQALLTTGFIKIKNYAYAIQRKIDYPVLSMGNKKCGMDKHLFFSFRKSFQYLIYVFLCFG